MTDITPSTYVPSVPASFFDADPAVDGEIGQPNGIASLDSTGNVPLDQLGNVPAPTGGSTANPGDYGTGADGDVVLSTDLSLARAMYFNSLDTAGFNIETNGFPLYVRGTLTVRAASTLSCTPPTNNHLNLETFGSAYDFPALPFWATLCAFPGGGVNGMADTPVLSLTNLYGQDYPTGIDVTSAPGGESGAGGPCDSNAGGQSYTPASDSSYAEFAWGSFPQLMGPPASPAAVLARWGGMGNPNIDGAEMGIDDAQNSAGVLSTASRAVFAAPGLNVGGAGAGDSSASKIGGWGGRGGGYLLIFAYNVVFENGCTLAAPGQKGDSYGDATVTSFNSYGVSTGTVTGGAGGGGGGGVVFVTYHTKTGTYTSNVAGGDGGTNEDATTASAGSAGQVQELIW